MKHWIFDQDYAEPVPLHHWQRERSAGTSSYLECITLTSLVKSESCVTPVPNISECLYMIFLLTGPDLNNDLQGVLKCFPHEQIAVTVDIDQMLHSFITREDHRNFLRFL